MKSVLENTCLEFIALSASSAPTPGGGSVAMTTAAHGLALILMALRVSRNKASEDLRDDYDYSIARGEALMKKIIASVDQDILVFELLMSAYKFPKNTEAEKEARKSSIQKSLLQATEEPLRSARLCFEGLELARDIKPNISSNIYSDLKAGALILEAACKAVALNIDINIPSIEDQAKAETYRVEKETILKDAHELVKIF